MKHFCDKCGAEYVMAGNCKPLSAVWGPNQIPFKECACEKCGKVENCMVYPDIISGGGKDVLSMRLPATFEIHCRDMVVPRECAFVEFNGERFIRVSVLTRGEMSAVVERI